MADRTLIVGGGAIGGVLAARLTRAGHDVTVLDAHAEHVARMRDPGLRVNLVGEEVVVRLAATSHVDDLEGTFDFGIVTLKAPHIEAALRPLAETGTVDAFVSLGNGLVQDRIADIVGPASLLVGTVSWGATNLGPGHVAQTTVAPIAIGELDGTVTTRLRSLERLLADACEVHLTDTITGQVWAKLLLNSTFSGLGVVTGLTYREVVNLPDGPDLCIALWTEGFRVAMRQGTPLDNVAGIDPRHIAVLEPGDRSNALRAIEDLMSGLGPTKASMLQDIEAGRHSEVDVINGGVAEAGRRTGVATPLNDAVVAIVHSFESGQDAPRPDAVSLMTHLLDVL